MRNYELNALDLTSGASFGLCWINDTGVDLNFEVNIGLLSCVSSSCTWNDAIGEKFMVSLVDVVNSNDKYFLYRLFL